MPHALPRALRALRALAMPLLLGAGWLALSGSGAPGAAAALASAQDPAREPAQERSCKTAECHAEYAGLRYAHGPAALGMCLACHTYEDDATPYEPGDDHYFDTLANDGNLCVQCHEDQAHEDFVHYPLRRLKCITCHDPHGSQNPGMMRHENTADNCFECHERHKFEAARIHAPVRVGACTMCHDPHGSPYEFQVVAEGSQLCLRCHVDVLEKVNASRHAHRPVLENCASCHDPHRSDEEFMLRKKVPGLCLECHQGMANHIEEAPFKHGALDDERSCLKCHEPHAADLTRQLRGTPVELCLSCHDREIVAEDRVLPDMEAYLELNPDHHGPIRTGDCAACHNPHGSFYAPLLYKAYPPDFYATFELSRYSLCFSCHQQSLVLDPETELLTSFRNGTRNLHFVHVNRADKGRTCRACHDVHASQHPKHISNSIPFGAWQMPIGYEKTDSGGSCSPGCHEPRRYDRIEAIDNFAHLEDR